jgi:Flp pilus assembly protein TadG
VKGLGQQGSVSLEMLFNLPLLLMIFVLIFETGFIMLDWAVVNYAAASAAVNAAANGRFSEDIRDQTIAYLRQWSTEGKKLFFVSAEESPAEGSQDAVIWGTPPDVNVQRGNDVEVGIYYPIKFKLFLVDSLMRWLTKEHQLALHAHAVAQSEVYFEP